MLAPPVQYAQTEDGLAIAWTERGDGPPLIASTGPMIPLDHGWNEGGLWARLSESFRVVRFDPRGCGLSTQRNAFGSFYDEAKDLLAVVSAVGAPQVSVLGYYLGAPTAAIACIEEPERFSHLILHHPIPLSTEEALYTDHVPEGLGDEVISGLLQMGWQFDVEPARRALLMLLAPETEMKTLRRLSQTMAHYPSVERLLQIIPEIRALNLVSDLGGLTARTLISVMPSDAQHGHGRTWAQAIRGARLSIVSEEGWILEDGNPLIEELARSIEDFVRVSARPPALVSATRTVLFTDIEGSTDLVQRLGDVSSRQITRAVEDLTRHSLRFHGGNEVKSMGDGVMAWFTMASAALDAAVDLQQSLERRDDLPVRLRIGLSAGEPISEGDDLFGSTVNQTARIMGLARGGQIFVSDIVRGLVQGRDYRFHDLGERQLRGFEEAAKLYQLEW